jgi:hypothetical protein
VWLPNQQRGDPISPEFPANREELEPKEITKVPSSGLAAPVASSSSSCFQGSDIRAYRGNIMTYRTFSVSLAALLLVALTRVPQTRGENYLTDQATAPAVPAAPAAASVAIPAAAPAADPPPDEKGPPLPFIDIEGVGGGAITPMAYLVNPGDDCHFFGKPSVAMDAINAGQKNLEMIAVTDTLDQRVEIGYSAERLGLGTLPGAIQTATGIDIGTDDVWLHSFDARALLVKEDKDGILGDWTPAVTAGVEVKYNGDIDSINTKLLGVGGLTAIGYRNAAGVDYTLTATKTFPKFFGRPVIATAGLRLSEAADIGFLGFGDTYHATFEGNVACLVTDKILVAYEFRQKTDPYGTIPGLIGTESNWHAIDLAYIFDKHTTFVAGWGALGVLADTTENGAWYFQMKHEF